MRQASSRRSACVGLVVALFVDPDVYRRFWRRDLRRHRRRDRARLRSPAPSSAGSKRWLDLGFFRFQPSEFGKLLFVLALAGFLADAAKRLQDDAHVARGDRPRCDPDLCSCSSSRTSARRSSTAPRSPPCCSSPARAGLTSRALAGRRARARRCRALGRCRRPASTILKPYQAAAPHRLHEPRPGSRRGDVQRHAVDQRGRRGRARRPRRRRRDADEPQLPARARDRLRLRLARRAARLRRRLDPAAALPARRLARPEDRRGRAGRLLGDRRRRDRVRASSSRSSSTSA